MRTTQCTVGCELCVGQLEVRERVGRSHSGGAGAAVSESSSERPARRRRFSVSQGGCNNKELLMHTVRARR
eukprot:COSAG01_NODE_842_length_13174_cov_44.463250_6_plen_71_part_00